LQRLAVEREPAASPIESAAHVRAGWRERHRPAAADPAAERRSTNRHAAAQRRSREK
jgi:hypothetical protein